MFGAAGSWYYSTLAGLDRTPSSRSWQDLLINPPYSPSVLSQLDFAAASIDSPMGLAAASWTAVFPEGTDKACGAAPEKKLLALECVDPATGKVGPGVFSSVQFASYGTPSGSCSAGWQRNASCDGEFTAAAVAAACVGKARCVLNVSTAAMNKGNDPCFDVEKLLAVRMAGPCLAPPLFRVQATVPVGGVARVRVPMPAGAAVIREGGAVVWKGGAFVPGAAPGVKSGAALANGEGVEFSVGSGEYSFEASSV